MKKSYETKVVSMEQTKELPIIEFSFPQGFKIKAHCYDEALEIAYSMGLVTTAVNRSNCPCEKDSI